MQTIDINSFLRESIRNLKPYTSARDEFSGEADIYLDANENPHGSVDGSKNNRYPDPYQMELKKIVSKIKNVPINSIFLGNGSDEAIDLLFKAYCYPGRDKAIQASPTYGMYKVSADVNDVQMINIPLDETYQPIAEKLINHGIEGVKILFLCSPNNPTGNLLNPTIVEQIVANFKGIVIVDEAYIDFAPTQSFTQLLPKYPNLVVLQTFSKAWGLANIRLGMMFAHPEIIAVMNKIKLPYNISGVIQVLAAEALQNEQEKNRMVADILTERARLIAQLPSLGCVLHVYPSDANFLLVKTTNPKAIYRSLIEKGIVVRDRSSVPQCEGTLRITIGTKAENDVLLDVLKQY